MPEDAGDRSPLNGPEQQLRLFVEGISDYSVLTLDPSGIVMSWNAGARKIKGYEADEIVGRHFSIFYTPDDIAEGRPQTGLDQALERGRFEDAGLRVRKGGETFSAEVVIMPIRDPVGALLGYGKITRDVSEKAAADVRLRASEARLQTLVDTVLDTLVDGLIIIDRHGLIQHYNRACERLFGYRTDEVVGNNVKMLTSPTIRKEHDQYLRNYEETGVRKIICIYRTVTGQRKDGTLFPMHLAVGEATHEGEQLYVGVIRDLTAQHLAEDRLKELQSEVTHMSRFTALGEMASTLAHEINQPLTAIANYLKGCRRLLEKGEGLQNDVLRDAVGKAGDQALRAGHIIRRLREFVARGESDRRIEHLPKLIEEASVLALIGATENGVAVSYRLAPDADYVLADRIQIQQVLVNLVRNAIEAMSESSNPRVLEIATTPTVGQMFEVSVSDSGTGLAPEIAAHLFQPFVTTKRTGMGLGLSICRTIVEAHGGKIWVDSKPGGGTVFRFTLRAGKPQDTPHV